VFDVVVLFVFWCLMSWSCLYSGVWCRGLVCIRVFDVVVLFVFGCLMSWSCLYSGVWCRGLVCNRVFGVRGGCSFYWYLGNCWPSLFTKNVDIKFNANDNYIHEELQLRSPWTEMLTVETKPTSWLYTYK
jgi:hypothetical protein